MKGQTVDSHVISLHRLGSADLELVRTWRNSPEVSQYMEFRDPISPQMQRAWFDRINNDRNYYFIIGVEDRKIGLANLKDVDLAMESGEAGIFIVDDPLRTMVAYPSAFALLDFAFRTLHLRVVRAHILRENLRAIRFNVALGYVAMPGQESVHNQMYCLTREVYEARTVLYQERMREAGIPMDCRIVVEPG